MRLFFVSAGRDNYVIGEGIAAARFVKRTKPTGEGTGLGLSISHDIL